MVRYKILDELLRDQYHEYSINDLTQEVNDYLSDLNSQSEGVGLRTIQKDLNDLKSIFLVDIKEWWVSYYNKELRKTTQKKCFRYTDPSFSIFKKELSDDEKFLIREALSLLGKFDGLPDFDGLNSLKSSLGIDKSYNAIVSFDKNPREEKTFFGELFTAISQKQVIEITYHKPSQTSNSLRFILHPHLLKEYNRRWWLLATDPNDNILKNFSLDRIDSVTPLPSLKYVEYPDNFNDRFDEIIGVTFFNKEEPEDIHLWASYSSKEYISSKPPHNSYKPLNEELCKKYMDKYPHLTDGLFFKINCRANYELYRELASYGKDLIVLYPPRIQNEVIKRIQEMNDSYSKLRK